MTVDEQRYPTVHESAELAAFRKTCLKTQKALRQTGIEFHRHYTASVACVPARTCCYTGHYPSQHGVANTDGTAKEVHDPEMFWLDTNSVPTIDNYFRTAGYRIFYKGKWHISHVDLTVPGARESLASYDADGNRDPQKEALYLAAKRLTPVSGAVPGQAACG
jgi:choline-sulfatase